MTPIQQAFYFRAHDLFCRYKDSEVRVRVRVRMRVRVRIRVRVRGLGLGGVGVARSLGWLRVVSCRRNTRESVEYLQARSAHFACYG